MKYTATPNTKRWSIPIFILLTASLASILLSTVTNGFAARFTQITAITLFTGAVLLIPAVLLYDYTYSADDGEFTVVRHNKKARTVICRIYIGEITAVLTKREGKKLLKETKKAKEDIGIYNYCPNPFFNDHYCLLCGNADGKSIIKIECPPAFASYINNITKKDPPIEL